MKTETDLLGKLPAYPPIAVENLALAPSDRAPFQPYQVEIIDSI